MAPVSLLDTLTFILATCKRHLSRAASKLRTAGSLSPPASLLSRRSTAMPYAWGSKKRKLSDEEEHRELWRKTILMGEKCQPLNFSGAIYYDAEGLRLSEIPTPRSPLRSPLPAFMVPITIADGKVRHE